MPILGDITFYSILWFCAGGHSFFAGIALLTITAIIHYKIQHKVFLLGIYLLYAIFVSAILLSSTPLSGFLYLLWIIILISWLIIRNRQPKYAMHALCILIGINFGLVLMETPWHLQRTITVHNIQQIYVIGDSVSAGMGTQDEKTWPVLLSEKIDVPVTNLAIAGATAGSALKRQAPKVVGENNLVFLEIGGNDLLNHNAPERFEENMTEMVHHLRKSSNTIIWFELPLLPQYYQYGRIQRQLAKQLNIQLIRRSVLATIFSTEGNTSDGIHLTQNGQEMMSQKIKEMVKR